MNIYRVSYHTEPCGQARGHRCMLRYIKRILLSCFLVLFLCACTNKEEKSSSISGNNLASATPTSSEEKRDDLENAMNDAMTALKDLDMEKFNAYTLRVHHNT